MCPSRDASASCGLAATGATKSTPARRSKVIAVVVLPRPDGADERLGDDPRRPVPDVRHHRDQREADELRQPPLHRRWQRRPVVRDERAGAADHLAQRQVREDDGRQRLEREALRGAPQHLRQSVAVDVVGLVRLEDDVRGHVPPRNRERGAQQALVLHHRRGRDAAVLDRAGERRRVPEVAEDRVGGLNVVRERFDLAIGQLPVAVRVVAHAQCVKRPLLPV
mmetsp:Transcript_20510/g.63812  ORF Transcript_20510/g.63812 Transcript_20510/m.63812 type:complete len:223 (-) Transcript_20510:403-1071(-)